VLNPVAGNHMSAARIYQVRIFHFTFVDGKVTPGM